MNCKHFSEGKNNNHIQSNNQQFKKTILYIKKNYLEKIETIKYQTNLVKIVIQRTC